MRFRLLAAALLGAIGLAVWPWAAPGATAGASQFGNERITDYDVTIIVERSGDLAITEVIDYDFGVLDRHGIFRNIPVRLHYDDRYDRVYPLTVRSVTGSPGTPDQYEASNEGGDKVLKIGDPDKTISGPHTYTIEYVVKGGLNGFAEHDELYWNAIGTEWDVPIEQATVRVETPGPLTDVACFSGPFRSLLPCRQSDPGDRVATFATGDLAPHEAFTVVVGFQKGFVPEPVPVLDERWAFDRAFSVTPATMGASAGLLVLVVGGVSALLWRTGRDRRFAGSPVDIAFGSETGAEQKVPLLERATTPVEFAPPDDLRPGQVGTLVDEKASTLDVTATIVDLAVRGFLRIDEIPKEGWFGKKDWNLVELKEAKGLRNYEHSLLSAIFKGRSEVKLSALKNTFATALKKVEDLLYDDAVAQGWFAKRPDRTRTLWTVLGVLALVGSHRGGGGDRGHHPRRPGRDPPGGGRRGPAGGGQAHAPAHGEGHRHPPPGAGLPPVHRGVGEGAGPVRRETAPVLRVPALRHRLRRHREVGQGLRRHRRPPAGHGLVHRAQLLHRRQLLRLHERLRHHHVGDDLVHAVGVGRQRLQRGRVLRRRGRRGRRRVLVGMVAVGPLQQRQARGGGRGRRGRCVAAGARPLRWAGGTVETWRADLRAWAATWTGTT